MSKVFGLPPFLHELGVCTSCQDKLPSISRQRRGEPMPKPKLQSGMLNHLRGRDNLGSEISQYQLDL